jgi:beta-arabinofuranosyltransferase
MHIFAAPKPFLGDDAANQLRALESWLALEPRPFVTFLGMADGYRDVVKKYGVNWVPHIDSNFLGVPLFNAVFQVANESTADVVVIANADIVLFEDFPYTIRKVSRDVSKPWLAIGARWDVTDLPPDLLVQHGNGLQSDIQRRRLVRFARENGTLHTYGGIDVWAWNTRTRDGALFDGVMPHFVFGRGKYDNWLTHEVIAAGRRAVIDVSHACTLVHLKHDYHLVAEHIGQSKSSPSSNRTYFWNQGANVKFELYINTYLAAAHGSYNNQMGTILHAPFKMQACYESDGMCLIQRRRPNTCRCEHSSFTPRAQNDPFAIKDSRIVFCGLLSSESQSILEASDTDTLRRFVISGKTAQSFAPTSELQETTTIRTAVEALHGAVLEIALTSGDATSRFGGQTAAFGLPLVLEPLLDAIEHRTKTKTVVLTALNSNHKNLLMSFICSTRAAGVFPNVVIAALDDELYHFAVTRGLAVYLEESVYANDSERTSARSSSGPPSFHLLQSLRMRIARRLVLLGRKVLYMDPDVILLSNPIKYATSVIPLRVNFAFLGVSGSVSTAMFLARPSVQAFDILNRLSDFSVQQRIITDIKCDAQDMCIVPGSGLVSLFPQTQFRTVTSSGNMPSFEDSVGLVAVHVAVSGDETLKLQVLRTAAPFLDLYDSTLELCRR